MQELKIVMQKKFEEIIRSLLRKLQKVMASFYIGNGGEMTYGQSQATVRLP